jgi:hypothetical protein
MIRLPLDVQSRLATLRVRHRQVRAYALVDGAQYELSTGQRMWPSSSTHALFLGTPESAILYAGPWLVETEAPLDEHMAPLTAAPELETSAPVLTWLLASMPLRQLVLSLQERMNARLPDGRLALLRYWDPRILVSLLKAMTPTQRAHLLSPALEWQVISNGRRVAIEGGSGEGANV